MPDSPQQCSTSAPAPPVHASVPVRRATIPSIDSRLRNDKRKETKTIRTVIRLARRANERGLPGVFVIEIEIEMFLQPSTVDEFVWLGAERERLSEST